MKQKLKSIFRTKVNKVIAIMLSLAMVLSMVPNFALTAKAAESGTDYVLDTATTTLTIKTAEGAKWWNTNSDSYLAYTVKLAADIDVSDFNWVPVGSDNSFTGTFDGQGHSITGLTVNFNDTSTGTWNDVGLFGSTDGAAIKNVGLINASVSSTRNWRYSYVGSFVGIAQNKTTITNCYNTGSVSGTTTTGISVYVGGIVGCGYSDTAITNCYNTGNVSATASSDAYAGGILGDASGSNITITNSYYFGGSENAVGNMDTPITATSCGTFNTSGVLTAGTTAQFGGSVNQTLANGSNLLIALNGWVKTTAKPDYYSWKTVPGVNSGYPVFFPTAAQYAAASPEAAEGAGKDYELDTSNKILTIYTAKGAAFWSANGTAYLAYTVKLAADIDVSGFNWAPVGTFTGTFDGQGHSITGLTIHDTGNVTYNYVGLFSSTSGATIKNVGLINSSVSITGGLAYNYNFVGGIVGHAESNTVITNCYNTGNVSVTTIGAFAYVGGIVGCAESNTVITNCYNTGSISASSNGPAYAGGILGDPNGMNIAITNSYNLAGSANAVGFIFTPITATSCGTFTDNGGTLTAGTTAQFGGSENQTLANGSNLLTALNGWVKTTAKTDYYTWKTVPGVNNGYPVLDKAFQKDGEVKNISSIGKTYDGTAVSAPTYDKLGTGAATIEYKVKDADDSTYTTTAPKNAGNYTVRVSVAADGAYKAASATADFSIAQKEVTITGATVSATKEYDGNATAQIANNGALSANYDGDNLKIAAGTAAYNDKTAANGKTVTFTGFTLTGSAKDNYKLTAQPANTTANITQKGLTVNVSVKDKQYNGKNDAEFNGTPALTGVIAGDKVNLTNGTPTFASTAIASSVAINFTAFTISGDDAGNYALTQPTGITASIKNSITPSINVAVSGTTGQWTQDPVTFTLSNTVNNIFSVTYWVKVGSDNWTQLSGNTCKVTGNVNTTYQFKAVFGSGLSSSESDVYTVKLASDALKETIKDIDNLPNPNNAPDKQITDNEQSIKDTKILYDMLSKDEQSAIGQSRIDKLNKLISRLNTLLVIVPKDASTGITAGNIGTSVNLPELNDPGVGKVVVKLAVNPITSTNTQSANIAIATQSLGESGTNLVAAFDISLIKSVFDSIGNQTSTGKVSNSNIKGPITIQIPVPAGYQGRTDLQVVYIDNNGNVTPLTTTLVTIDGVQYLQFTTTHFSVYAITAPEQKSPVHNPQTGDSSSQFPMDTLSLFGLAVLAIFTGSILFLKKKLRKQEGSYKF